MRSVLSCALLLSRRQAVPLRSSPSSLLQQGKFSCANIKGLWWTRKEDVGVGEITSLELLSKGHLFVGRDCLQA